MARVGLICVLVALAAGCGEGEPADVAGQYTITVTNGPNDCALDNWMPGQSTAAIPLTVTQDPMNRRNVTGVVGGLAGVYVNLVLGSNTFQGTVRGSTIDMSILGTRRGGMGSCAWTLNAEANADVRGELITGTLRYRFQTNGAPDCGSRNSCANVQNFNGTRPPPP